MSRSFVSDKEIARKVSRNLKASCAALFCYWGGIFDLTDFSLFGIKLESNGDTVISWILVGWVAYSFWRLWVVVAELIESPIFRAEWSNRKVQGMVMRHKSSTVQISGGLYYDAIRVPDYTDVTKEDCEVVPVKLSDFAMDNFKLCTAYNPLSKTWDTALVNGEVHFFLSKEIMESVSGQTFWSRLWRGVTDLEYFDLIFLPNVLIFVVALGMLFRGPASHIWGGIVKALGW